MNGDNENRKIMCDMAHYAFNCVTYWLSRDQFFAEKLRSTGTGSRQIVDEETITVDLAMKLLEKYPKNINITLFTHPEETRTGADWYWRIEKGEYAIHALVQAKRIHRRKFEDPDESGNIDINLSQLRQLLYAQEMLVQEIGNLQIWFAVYSRNKNAFPPCKSDEISSYIKDITLNNCEYHQHSEDCAGDDPSLWILNVQKIPEEIIPKEYYQESTDKKKQEVKIGKIIQNSIRLDCLLPCIGREGTGSSPSKKGFVLKKDIPSFDKCVDTIVNNPLLRNQFTGALNIHT